MVFYHGKSTAVLVDEFDLTSYFRDHTSAQSADTAETSAFGDDAKTYLPGMIDGTISLGGLWSSDTGASDPKLQETFGEALGASGGMIFSVYPSGFVAGSGASAVGLPVITGGGECTQYDITQATSDVVQTSASIQADGGARHGVTLHGLVAQTTSTSGNSVDNGTGTTNGGYGTLHVTNVTAGSADVTIQHSVDGAVWTDLITFSNFAAVGAERIAVSGTVNRYLRCFRVITTGPVSFATSFVRC